MTENTHITIQGQRLFVSHRQDHSQRPTLVFLHDSLGCTQLWRDFPERLAQATQCNFMVYDRLGYGQSDPMDGPQRDPDYLHQEAQLLDGLLEELQISNAILFGHSDGGSIALIAAALYPKRIKAIICEAAHIFVEDITLQGIGEAQNAYRNSNLPERLHKYHGNKTDTVFKAWTQIWTSAAFRDWNLEPLLPQISCPLLFVQGENDEFGTAAQMERCVAQSGGFSKACLIPMAGHTAHRDQPETVIREAAAFVKAIGF